MASTASVGGIISGLDTNTILDQLYQVAQAPIKRVQARQDQLRQQSTAWSQLEGRLLSLQTAATRLATATAFRLQKASVSRPELVTATTSSSAISGSYSLSVERLAQSHQVVSQGYGDLNQTEVGSGTISITVGDGEATVIAVDNFTLAELRDAINASGAGVSAALVNDGSESNAYRLILTSRTSGLEGQMQVQVSLSGGVTPVLSELQAAQEAMIKLGSGAGAITITSGSNAIREAVPGVTLDLLKAEPSALVSLTLSRDTTAIQGQIEDLIEAYNSVVDFVNEQFSYDPTSGQTGTLFAEYQLQSLQGDLSAVVTNQVVGVSTGWRALADIGIRTLSDGKLLADSASLGAALVNDAEAVMKVLAAVGEPTSQSVTYLSSTSDTRPSGSAGWAIEITQAASRSRVTAGVAQMAALDGDETLTVRGVTIQLTAGMTQAQVIAAINEHSGETGVVASATGAGGSGAGNYLTLWQVAYGAAYHVDAVSTRSNQGGDNSGIGNLTVSDQSPVGEAGLGTGETGQTVAGTIGGQAAPGSGQRLTGIAGDPTGLAVLVTASAPGSYGTIVFTVGAAEAALRLALSATDRLEGVIALAQDSIDDRIASMEEEIARLQALAEQENQRMSDAFARMESALGRFQAQSQYLAAQFAQMQRNAVSDEG